MSEATDKTCNRCGSSFPPDMPDATLLRGMLDIAVMVEVDRLRWVSWRELSKLVEKLAQDIAAHGDVILYRGSKKGETARAFASLATAITILSFSPGGVSCLGGHWCNKHPETISVEAQYRQTD